MTRIFVGIFLVALLSGCNTDEGKTIILTDSLSFTDSVIFEDLGVELKFNDQNLFDTTFVAIRYYFLCSFGADFSKNNLQPKFSNKNFNNEDTLSYTFDSRLDSFLYLNFYWQILEKEVHSIEDFVAEKEEHRNISRMATKSPPYDTSFNKITRKNGVEFAIIGGEVLGEDQLNFTNLEAFAIFDTLRLVAHFEYTGKNGTGYLEDFIKVAESMVLVGVEN